MRKAYKDYNKCSNQGPRPFVQPPHVHSQQMSCTEYGYDCAENSKVVECEFRGGLLDAAISYRCVYNPKVGE